MSEPKYAIGCLSAFLIGAGFWVAVVWWVWWR